MINFGSIIYFKICIQYEYLLAYVETIQLMNFSRCAKTCVIVLFTRLHLGFVSLVLHVWFCNSTFNKVQ